MGNLLWAGVIVNNAIAIAHHVKHASTYSQLILPKVHV